MLIPAAFARHAERARGASTITASPKLVQCKSNAPCDTYRNTGRGDALDARAIQGAAVNALSRQGIGMIGTTLGAPLNQFYATAGILGVDNSVNGLPNTGVQGVTSAAGDAGVVGDFAAYGSTGIFGVGVLGDDQSGPGLNRNVIGVLGESEGTGVFGLSMATPAPPGSMQAPGVNAACAGGGVALLASNGFVSPGGDLMSVDCAGNMILKGDLVTDGTPLTLTRTSGGQDVAMYQPKQPEPTIEDFGEAQLVDGSAYVRIDPGFASTINPSCHYLVFLTPDGPSRGLYVTDKSLAGFSVHENPGGHATLAFDYRIVAKPLGAPAPRLATAHDVEMSFYRQALRAPHSTQSAARWVSRMRQHARRSI
jgi:hypothetical protein